MRAASPATSLSVTGELQAYPGLAGSGGGRMRGDVDLRVPDLVALEEIELYAEVLSAVAMADRPLTTEEIDEVLGLGQLRLRPES